MLEVAGSNLATPAILAFLLGVAASLLKSDLRLPEPIYQTISIYLLFAIGLKGGAALADADAGDVVIPALVTLALGLVIPLWVYAATRFAGRMSIADSAALAAHYGSTSVVTFTAALTFLQSVDEPVEGFLPTLVAIMEVPAIVVALVIARLQLARTAGQSGDLMEALHEVLVGRSIILLAGGLLVGLLAGSDGIAPVEPFFVDAFQGILTLFLLEMGIVTARRFGDLRAAGPFLIGFGLLAPVLNGAVGVIAGDLAGLSAGGAAMLGVLAASASYIAAPAAVRIALPEANPSLYLTASLAVTFPFNLTVGIPLYYELAGRMAG
ncbi:MAG: sodium-dependent bicarbonate transport family permease [Dehalococcoidia bacterium]